MLPVAPSGGGPLACPETLGDQVNTLCLEDEVLQLYSIETVISDCMGRLLRWSVDDGNPT